MKTQKYFIKKLKNGAYMQALYGVYKVKLIDIHYVKMVKIGGKDDGAVYKDRLGQILLEYNIGVLKFINWR